MTASAANITNISQSIREFDLRGLFIEELGWDRFTIEHAIEIDGMVWRMEGVAEKRGFQVFRCVSSGEMPDRTLRQRIDGQLAKMALEHLVVFIDAHQSAQRWQWAYRQPEKPVQYFNDRFDKGDSGERLAQKLQHLFISINEDERLTVLEVGQRVSQALRRDRVTKKFYERFDKERKAFMPQIDGIPVQDSRDWYASIMLNRLMFVYFIQQKGFLNHDPHYLRNKLREVQARQGRDQFYGFYREFLLKLFHQGLGSQPPRPPEIEALLGDVPYLNGGIFDQHQIEVNHPDIRIPDEAFETLFDFFDAYDWHLDDRPLRDDTQINPDVLGYIFEKYINQKQMGAYYTKEDITEYISKNTIVPCRFDQAKQDGAIAFRPDGALWALLREDPDRYFYDAVKKGVDLPLPPEIEAGRADVAQRGGWNKPAAEGYALPTETWREHVSRRTRYEEIFLQLVGGEVTSIDDLITYNLNIRQFAQDVIQHAEGPELVRAVFKAIRSVSVLDPTCGSGAFLFAALNILAPLYDACLERMEEFVTDLDRSDEPHRPEKFSDFRAILKEADARSRRYYIYKSIILNNLYGVDIMEEAVEICKLRLFLKLASELQAGEHIEPLPDIDFNIRAGNTLVGFASMDEVRKAIAIGPNGNARLMLPEDMEAAARIEERAEIAARAFQLFHEQQTTLGGKVTAKDKADLRRRLADLNDELDRYLAALYGIHRDGSRSQLEYEQNFNTWRESHQPFHWLVDFYGITRNGGFDVVIGNPPYVSLSTLEYELMGYESLDCGDIYAPCVERSITALVRKTGRFSMIIPISSVSTEGYQSIRDVYEHSKRSFYAANFAERPSKLFEGADKRLTILIAGPVSDSFNVMSTKYHRWLTEERDILLKGLRFIQVDSDILSIEGYPKISDSLERSVLLKLQYDYRPLAAFLAPGKQHLIRYTRKLRYFIQFFVDVPRIVDEGGRLLEPSELKTLRTHSQEHRDGLIALLNSNLFFWFFIAFSDCRNVNQREIMKFPVGLDRFDDHELEQLSKITKRLLADLSLNARMLPRNDRRAGPLLIESFQPRLSKPIIDEIDRVLARHYGFTDEELDFIINYDIKYRMGRDGLDGDE